MKKLILVAAVACALSAQGAAIYTSSFGLGSEGWTDRDLGKMTVSYESGIGYPAGSLKGSFAAQGTPISQTDAFRASTGTGSGGTEFVGDYSAVNTPYAITKFTFDFYAATVLPSDLTIRFNGNGFTFFRSVGSYISGIGNWYTVTAPLTYDASWIGGGIGTEAADFATALQGVSWVDVAITRNGTNSQAYYMDNFATAGTSGGGEEGEGGIAVPEPRMGIFALWIGALLLSRRKALRRA